MSQNQDDSSSTPQQNNPDFEIVPPTQQKASELIEKFEAFALKQSKPGLDFDKLNTQQVDKVLEIMAQNETNAFNYHCKRLETAEKINLANITSKSAGERTFRISFICTIIAVVIITMIILFVKEKYFIPWISFIGGNLSGLGISKLPHLISKEHNKKSTEIKDPKTD
ncbi:MAG: hypothetical protein JST87_14375 [Bacteroidetes bacterium]|nr:hypothetical protein [Bacteroidota bacterium]